MQRALPMSRTVLVFALASSWAVAASANDPAVVTLIEGKATIASGIHTYLPAPGVKVGQCDIVRTADKGMVQLESVEGARIELGANTHFLADVARDSGGDPQERAHFLRSGWVKLTVGKAERPKPQRVQTPYFDVVIEAGIAVMNIAGSGALFVQEGKAVVLDRAGGAGARVGVGTGQTYSRKSADAKPVVSERVDPAFVKAMPPSFRDTVPSLLAGLKGRDVQAKRAPDYDHADLLVWQKTDPLVRQCIDDRLIRSAQEALQQAGIDVGPIDGVLGPRTQGALREFQKQHKLTQSGLLDEQSVKALGAR